MDRTQFAFTAKPSTVIRSTTLVLTDILDKSRATSSSSSRHLLGALSPSAYDGHRLTRAVAQLGRRVAESRFYSFRAQATHSQLAG